MDKIKTDSLGTKEGRYRKYLRALDRRMAVIEKEQGREAALAWLRGEKARFREGYETVLDEVHDAKT